MSLFFRKEVNDTGIIANVMNAFHAKYRPLFFSRGEYMPTGTLRDSDIVGAIADAIAKNVGKLKPQVIRYDEKGMVIKNDGLARLLALRPCPEMSTYDFLYRIASDLVYTSNSFSVVFYNEDFTRIKSIQPIQTRDFRIFVDENGNILFRFRWEFDGKYYTVPYQMVIHIKARFNKKRFLGTSPDLQLKSPLDLIETSGEMIKNLVKNSGTLGGYLKYNNFADDEELKRKTEEFMEAYMKASNAGGIAALDSTYEFKELKQSVPAFPTAQIGFLRENVYRYYGVNEKILTSTFNESDWNAFYENVIEPIAIQLSLECMFKLLTEREISFGNKIIFTANRLQYATLQTRAAIGGEMFDRGAITINEYRELLYYEQIEDGDVRMVSLNYVKAGDQSQYQVGDEGGSSGGDRAQTIKSRDMEKFYVAYIQTRKKGGMAVGRTS